MTAFVELAAIDDGPPDSRPVVLLNSLGCTPGMWDQQAAALLASGRRVIRYDHRGHGQSPVPPGPYEIEDLGADLLALLDRLGIGESDLIGLSLGGMVAMWVAATAPDRVRRLVVCCSSAHLPPAQGWYDRAEDVRSDGMRAVVDPLLERWLTGPFQRDHPEVVARLRAMLLSMDPEGYARCCEAIARMDLRRLLPEITAPTLVMAASDDRATPAEHSRLIAAGVPNARLATIGPSGHLASVERAATLSRLVLEHVGRGHEGGDP